MARRERCTAGAQSGPNPSCGRSGTWKRRFSSSRLGRSKAGPGETAWRGSNEPRPLCNRANMPTSIWSFVVRTSMEPFLLRKANVDRHPSIGASQTRHKDCRASRPLTSMAKVEESGAKRCATCLPNRGTPHREVSIERLEPCEGKLSCTVLRGA